MKTLRTNSLFILLLVIIAGISSSLVWGQLDEVQSLMLAPYQIPLRWDNVEGNPEWVEGVKPVYSFKKGMHIITLKPGQFVRVRVTSGRLLRIFNPCTPFTPYDVTMDISNGSGLYARLPVSVSDNFRSILGPVAWLEPQLVLVSRPIEQKEPIQIALFISRYEPLNELAPYRKIIPLGKGTVKMGRELYPAQQTFWTFKPGLARSVVVKGPTRFAFENRLAYSPYETKLSQAYQLKTFLDGQFFRTIQFESSQETESPVFVDRKVRVMGRARVGYIEIPPGKHVLAITATTHLYGRLLEQENPDYLFPQLNGPLLSAEVARQHLSPYLGERWALNSEQIKTNALSPAVSPSQKEYVSERILRDNTHREGGMLATSLMQITAMNHIDYPAIKTLADDFAGYHTFYRDIFPMNKMTGSDQYLAWFIASPLHNVGQQGKGLVLGEQFLQELLDRISGAFFNELPSPPPNRKALGYTYQLPPRATSTYLRIAVDSGRSSLGGQFYVQLGNNKPIAMHVAPNPELSINEYALTQGGGALDILAQLRGELLYGTLSAIFSENRMPAFLIPANVFEIPLPANVQEIKVWNSSPNCGRIRLAMQYRAAKPYTFSESEYKGTVHQLCSVKNVMNLFQKALRIPFAQGLNDVQREMQNNWVPLLRFLTAEYKQFSLSVSKSRSRDRKVDKINSASLDELHRQAKKLVSNHDWLPALEIWTKLEQDGSPRFRHEAQVNIVESLFHLGEGYLAEQNLRGYLLFSNDSSLRRWAARRLLSYYQSNQDIEAITTLSATLLFIHPDIVNAKRMVEILLEYNEPKLALMVGLTIPIQYRPLEPMLRAAYLAGWWETFNNLLVCLKSNTDRAFWQGLRAQQQGHMDEAVLAFDAAGARGRPWRNQIINGRNIIHELFSPDLNIRVKGIKDWARWQSEQPGPYVWNEDASVIRDYERMMTLYSVERDVYGKAFQGTKKRPVYLQIFGPVKVRLEVRPLMAINWKLPLDGWINVKEGNTLRLFPMNGIIASQGLKLIDHPKFLPGEKVFADFYLPPGIHHLKVDGGDNPILVRPLLFRPEIAILSLPPLTKDAVTAAFDGAMQAERPLKIPFFF